MNRIKAICVIMLICNVEIAHRVHEALDTVILPELAALVADYARNINRQCFDRIFRQSMPPLNRPFDRQVDQMITGIDTNINSAYNETELWMIWTARRNGYVRCRSITYGGMAFDTMVRSSQVIIGPHLDHLWDLIAHGKISDELRNMFADANTGTLSDGHIVARVQEDFLPGFIGYVARRECAMAARARRRWRE